MISRVLGLALCMLVVAPSLAGAGPKANSADVRIRVIHAKMGRRGFDPRLSDLARYLKIYKYSSYQQVIDQTLTLAPGDTRGIGLLKGKNLNATLEKLDARKATLRLKLFGAAGVMLDTKVAVGRNGLFFIAGPRYDNGVLFVSVGARYDVHDEEARVSGHQ